MRLFVKRIFQEQPVRLIALLFFSALFPRPSAGSTISFDISPRKITVGDPVELTLQLSVNEDARVLIPGQAELSPAEVIRIDTLRQKGKQRTFAYTLSLFEPGSFDLSDVPVIIHQGGEIDTLWFDPGVIEVESVISPEDSLADIRDIRPPVELGWSWRDVLPYVVVFSLLLAAGIVGYIFWKKWNRRQSGLIGWEPPPPPPYQTALRKLEVLRIKKLWQNGFTKEYYSELVEIVKHYIGGRFGFDAPEMTTYELMNARDNWAPEAGIFKLIERIIFCADLVKFAEFQPRRDDNEKCLEAGFSYLEATKPDEAALSAAGENMQKAGDGKVEA